jgi:multicomponent Na+:H+ antiporter subunit E
MLSLGAISIFLVLFLARKMDVVDHESTPLNLSLRFPLYCVWLTKEVILANISVVKHILLGNETISPTLTTIKASQRTDLGKVIYANSITLTPGTVAVDLIGGDVLVHALLQESIDDLKAGDMDRRVSRLEK